MKPKIDIVDDDCAVRDSLAQLLDMHGYETRQFADAESFLNDSGGGRGCILLDIRMPHMSGIDLQQEMSRRGREEPIVFVTGHGDIGLAVKAMKAGAANFLQKPCSEDALLNAVRDALAAKHEARWRGEVDEGARDALARLTERETEVLGHVCRGLTSKAVARLLNISVRTVDIHRANMMNKTNTRNVVELVGVAFAGGFIPDRPEPKLN
jgi:FixJ family two-component response regulator